MKSVRTVVLIAGIISFLVMTGGGTYEHIAAVPRWKMAPPASLTMFQGPYGLAMGDFWRRIHPCTVILLITALVLNWKTARRKFILLPIGIYLLLLVITATFFVPELLSIVRTPYSQVEDKSLTARAALWETLSLVRLFICFVAGGILLFSLTKGNQANNS